MILDLRTLVLATAANAAVCLLVAVVLWRQARHRFRGLGYWLLDYLLQAVGLVLLLLRGRIPDLASMVVANVAIVSGSILGYVGLARFVGRPSRQGHNVLLLALFTAVHFYFAVVEPNLAARNLNLAVALLVVVVQCAWLLLVRVDRDMRRRTAPLGTVFALYGLACVVRVAEFLIARPARGDYFESGALAQGVMLAFEVLFVLLTFGFVLMVSGRLAADIGAQEEKYAKAFRSSPYAITLTRLADGRIIEVNDGFTAITGYSAADAVGTTTHELALWASDDDRAGAVAALSAKGRVVGLERTFRARTGEPIAGLFSAEVVAIGGEPHVLSSISDIGPLRRAQQEREALQARLAEADRLAGMGVVAAGVAHEINNPLTYMIDNLASVVEDLPRLAPPAPAAAGPHVGGREETTGATTRRPVPEGHRRTLFEDAASRLGDALEGARRIKRVVAALGTFSNAAPVGVGAIDVHRCIEHALRMARDELAERATIVRELAPVRRVLASEGQLSQVLLHLMLNAAQAIGPGQPERNELRVRTAPDGDRVRIEVSDSGCGIAPELQERVFEPFFTTRDAGAGLGLGLSIARNIVASLGGELALSSELGVGTTVTLWLPADPAPRP